MFAPKDQSIVQTKRKHSGDGEEHPVSLPAWEGQPARLYDRKEDCRSDYKSDSRKREGREIVKAELDE